VGIVSVTLIPILVLTGWLAIWLADSERAQLEQSARSQAQKVVATIDREIVSIQNVLTVLASSPFLHSGHLEEFYQQARAVSQSLGFGLVLRDRQIDRQVVNTAFPWGTPLTGGTPAPRTQLEDDLLRAGRPFISNVFKGPLIKQDVVAVIVPVFHGDELRYSIAAGVPLTRFAEILETMDFPADYLATVIDRNGIILTRSERHSEFAGTQVMTRFPLDTKNTGRSVNREGIPFHWFNRQSELTGWYFSVGIPDRVFDAPATRARATFAVAGTLLLGLAIAFAYRWGGQLARSTGALGIDRRPTREEFEVLFDAAPNGVMVIGNDGIIMLANRQVGIKFGYSQSELVGQPVEALIPERFRAAHLEHRAHFARKPEAGPMGDGRDLFGRRKDGSEFPVEVALNPISTGAENLVLATVVDISSRKRTLDKLSVALNERDELRRRHIQAQENERLRLAHDLHDQTGQTLTAAMLELKRLEAHAEGPQRDRLRSLRKQMEDVGKTLHRVAWELRPLSIDEVGLAGALSNYLSEWSARYGIEADLYCRTRRLDELPDETRTTIYRVVQEALTNVAKHAQRATEISVVIEDAEQGLRLTIDDNGCGFDTGALNAQGGGRGLGLAGIRERLSLIGGELDIESVIGGGTTIFAKIPLENPLEHRR
jgi:two-component system sensor kinase